MTSTTPDLTKLDRARGMMLGHLVGDALGAPYEFRSKVPDDLTYGRGVFGHDPGTGTDDTAVLRCCAETIIEHGSFVPESYAQRIVAWAATGPLDIGGQTAKAARSWATEGRPPPKSDRAAGNGALMGCAPLAFLSDTEPDRAAAMLSETTHPSKDSATACVGLVHNISAAVAGRETVLVTTTDVSSWDPRGEHIGWCLGTLHLAYLSVNEVVANGASPADALRWVIRQGGDTDTNAAVAGALLGALFGEDAWVELLPGLSEADAAKNLELAEGIARL